MTTAARQVLDDCEAALQMLEDEHDEQRWKVLWVGVMTLLRTVGHVLRKVDGEIPSQRAEIDAAYVRWKDVQSKHAVFWRFIEKERNNILKEYRLNVHDSEAVGLAVVIASTDTDCVAYETPCVLDENLFRPVTDGFGAGKDARDVYREALDWWDAELTRIELKLKALPRQGDH